MTKERKYHDLVPRFQETPKQSSETKLFHKLMDESEELEKNSWTNYGTVEQCLTKFLERSNPIHIKGKLLTPQVWWDFFEKEQTLIGIYLSLEKYFRNQEELDLFHELLLETNVVLGIPAYGF